MSKAKKAKRQERKRKFKAMKRWIGLAVADANLAAVAEKKVRRIEKKVRGIAAWADDTLTKADADDRARIGASQELRECMNEALTPLGVLIGKQLPGLGDPPLIPTQMTQPAPRPGRFVQAAPTLTDAQFEKFVRALEGDEAAGHAFLRDAGADEKRPADRAPPTRVVLTPEQERAAISMNLDPEKLVEAMAKDVAGDADLEKLKILTPEQRRAAISMNLGTKAMAQIAEQLQARRQN